MRIICKAIGLVLLIQYSTVAQSLDEYLRIAVENNAHLKARHSEFLAMEHRSVSSGILPDPQFSFGYFISPVETRLGPQQAKFGLRQRFPWFGTLSSKGDAVSFQADAKYQEYLAAKDDIRFRVRSKWYEMIELKNVITLQEEYLDILQLLKNQAISRFESGQGSMVDVIRADIMIEDTGSEIEILKEKETPLQTSFNKLLNRDTDIEVVIPDSVTLPPFSKKYRTDSLLSSQPSLDALDMRILALQNEEHVAKNEGLPSFGIGVDYVVVGKRTDIDLPDNGRDIIMPMMSVSIPIFRNKYSESVNESRMKQAALQASKEDKVNDLQTAYEFAMFDAQSAYLNVMQYRRQKENVEQALRLMYTEYSNSGKDFEEILRMQQRSLRYELAESRSAREYLTAMAKIDLITSKDD